MNISSIVVLTKQECLNEVIEKLNSLDFCDYFFDDGEGRIVVTIEGQDIADEMQKLGIIENIPNVISAQMQMSYSEEELDSLKDELEKTSNIPDVLTTEIDAKYIVYNGDLKGKM